MKIRAPVILHVFSTFARGGPQLRTIEIIKRLGEAYRHKIVAMDACFDAQSLLAGADNVEMLPPPDQSRHFLSRLTRYKSWLQRQSFDLLATYNWGAIEIAAAHALLRNRPHIHHEEGFGPDERDKRHLRRNFFRRLVLKSAAAVIVPSANLQDIAKVSWGVGSDKLLLIENGIDVSDFAVQPDVELLGLKKEEG